MGVERSCPQSDTGGEADDRFYSWRNGAAGYTNRLFLLDKSKWLRSAKTSDRLSQDNFPSPVRYRACLIKSEVRGIVFIDENVSG